MPAYTLQQKIDEIEIKHASMIDMPAPIAYTIIASNLKHAWPMHGLAGRPATPIMPWAVHSHTVCDAHAANNHHDACNMPCSSMAFGMKGPCMV
jgi:hypothetical protein